MTDAQWYILIGLVALAAVAVLVFLRWRQRERGRLSPLAGLAFACIVAAIVFGDERLLGYGLMAAGVALAVVDIVRGRRGGAG